MFGEHRRERRLRKVAPGTGRRLPEFRLWNLFSRTLFFLELEDRPGDRHVYAVDVRHLANELSTETKPSSSVPAALYRDGVQIARSNLPATFAVPGGVIDVATSSYGMRRMHYVPDGGAERTLSPHPRSAEGRRARFGERFPRASAAIGVTAVAILLVGLAVGIPQILEAVTRIDVVAERVGTFVSPIRLPEWANIALIVAGILAAFERALTLRSHWLIDFETTWVDPD